MSGIFTPGLVQITLPWTGNERIPLDTGASSGINPESAYFTAAQLTAAGGGSVVALTGTTTAAATITLDASTASYFSVTLNATNQVLTVSNPSPGQRVEIELVQGTTGSFTIGTWTSGTWPTNGTTPTLTTTGGKIDVFVGDWNATAAKWRYSTKGLNFA